jgi:hypothetical protein
MAANSPNPAQSRSTVGRYSRSAVGRTTGRLTRLIGHSISLQATGRFLRQQLWAWPIIAAILLLIAGLWVNNAVEQSMRQQRENELTTILHADIAALRAWIADQSSTTELISRDEQLLPLVQGLLPLADGKPDAARRLLQAPEQAALRARIADRAKGLAFNGFAVVAKNGTVIGCDQDPPMGMGFGGYRQQFFDQVLGGKIAVSKPYRSPLLLADENGQLKANVPTMFTGAPIRNAQGEVIATIGMRIRPEAEFTKILQVAQFGKSGETYAFDRNGMILSQSRFDDDLKQIGLLADLPDSKSVLTLEIRDPQANLMAGERPKLRRADQPLTKMAASAVKGESGCDPDGYRDYRGVPVVGAWAWLNDLDFGIATELDVAEAFHAEYILRRAFWVLMGMLGLCAGAIYFAMHYMARQQKALQKARLEARQLGQYALEDKLGAGGMGTVYKARHAMLRRPTAVKLLDVDKMSDAAVARFEREVQLTGTLTHPNTVAIYDYGRTPEGIFYYAMEYLEGINLDDLVKRHGPMPESRAVHILRQVCGSLAEAHSMGLVHRDIKPANIFLTRRGGMSDFVKVLDFGLVKSLDGEESGNITSANAVTGTPLYLSPEAVNQPDKVDARADVYAIGAVAYFLLTGTPVFSGATVMEICMKHVQTAPEPPSSRLNRPLSTDLEELILRCLEKQPEDRPADASRIQAKLESIRIEGWWSSSEAATWWAVAGKQGATPPAGETAQQTVTPVSTGQMTVAYSGEGDQTAQ